MLHSYKSIGGLGKGSREPRGGVSIQGLGFRGLGVWGLGLRGFGGLEVRV